MALAAAANPSSTIFKINYQTWARVDPEYVAFGVIVENTMTDFAPAS
jgi:hypothetical protein